jgi:nitrogen regulatory protein PII
MNQRDEVVKYLEKVNFNSMCARDLLNGFYEQLKETMKHEKEVRRLEVKAEKMKLKVCMEEQNVRRLVGKFIQEFNTNAEPLLKFLGRYADKLPDTCKNLELWQGRFH